MMYLCAAGMQHTWQPTGRWLFMWAAADTKASSRATNAPMAREEECCVCGAVRHTPNAPDVKRHILDAAE